MLIGVVGDFKAGNVTHETLNASLAHAGASWEWIATDEMPTRRAIRQRYAGLWIAPASPYRSMEGAIGAIRLAREHGVPLVGT